jgi:hypothetical protein
LVEWCRSQSLCPSEPHLEHLPNWPKASLVDSLWKFKPFTFCEFWRTSYGVCHWLCLFV